MALVSLPPMLMVAAFAFWRHVSGAVVAIEKLGSSGSGEQQSGLLALGAFTPVPRWLREVTPVQRRRFGRGLATREVASRLGFGCEGQPQEMPIAPKQRAIR